VFLLNLLLNFPINLKHQETSIIAAQRAVVSKTILANLYCKKPATSLTDSKFHDLGRASCGHGGHLKASMCLLGFRITSPAQLGQKMVDSASHLGHTCDVSSMPVN